VRCAGEGEGGCAGCPDVAGHACDEIVWPASESRSDIVVLAIFRSEWSADGEFGVETHWIVGGGWRMRGMRGKKGLNDARSSRLFAPWTDHRATRNEPMRT